MLASQVTHYLALRKSLVGEPKWIQGTRLAQQRLQWTVLCQGVGEGPMLEIKYRFAAPQPSFTVMLMVPPPLFRLDIHPQKQHINARAQRGLPRGIVGHHVHLWADNMPSKHVETLPRALGIARPYDGPVDFREAVVWACEHLNIEVDLGCVPAPPVRDTLL